MKANPLLTMVIFAALPISIAHAHSSTLKNAATRQVFSSSDFGNYAPQRIQEHDASYRSPCYLSAASNSPILSQSYDRAESARQQTNKLYVTNLDPQAAINYNNRGVAKFKSGDNYGAILDYDRAISINPKYAESYVNRGIAKFKLGKIQAAIKDYNQAIAINPQDGEAYYNRGIAQFELGEERAAIKDFDRAVAIDPQDAEVYGNRGAAKSILGDKPGAIADLKQAAKLFRQQGQMDNYAKMMEMVRQMTTY